MSKIVLFTLVGLLAVTAIMGRTADVKGCLKEVGGDCSTGRACCGELRCHPIALKCGPNITPQMLQDAKKKLKHVDNKYHK